MKSLVLAEKPSVGREIARVLGCAQSSNGYLEGSRYVVTWALGHLVTLADPDAYDKKYEKWDMETLPMLPEHMKLVVIPESRKQFNTVQSLIRRGDITEIIIATDAGREGELVARWILNKVGCQKPLKRLWISSQTDRAVREGFQKLRPSKEYDNLFRSAQARSIADWLVGLNVTRALTCKYNAQLSAGRVQTPTLALIVNRENEIRNFQPQEFWGISAQFDSFYGDWTNPSGSKHTFRKEHAQSIADHLKGASATVVSVSRKSKIVPPPLAYDLTELQRDANRKYAYSASETLRLMQSLYERHKILTYPRTDSRYITEDVAATLGERLKSCMVDEYKPTAQALFRSRPYQTKYLVNAAKVTDHHAILPTEEQPVLYNLSGPERNIYDLVVRRFFAVLMPPSEYEEYHVVLEINGQTFTAKGRYQLSAGWEAAYLHKLSDSDEDDEVIQKLPQLSVGQKLTVRDVTLRQGKTSPPNRYTEATLLTAMEHPDTLVQDQSYKNILAETSGLGTPATRAEIIEKLFSTFYIERSGKYLVPTSKGIQLISIAPSDLSSPELTAQWETKLSAISNGKLRDSDFIKDMRDYASALVSEVKFSDKTYRHDNQTRTPCPECGKYLLKVNTKRGEQLVCPDRECGYRRSLTQTTNARCPNCHKKMELRGSGDKQMFACACGYREKLSDFKKRRSEAGANKSDVRKYLNRQDTGGNTAMADALSKWMAANKEKNT